MPSYRVRSACPKRLSIASRLSHALIMGIIVYAIMLRVNLQSSRDFHLFHGLSLLSRRQNYRSTKRLTVYMRRDTESGCSLS